MPDFRAFYSFERRIVKKCLDSLLCYCFKEFKKLEQKLLTKEYAYDIIIFADALRN